MILIVFASIFYAMHSSLTDRIIGSIGASRYIGCYSCCVKIIASRPATKLSDVERHPIDWLWLQYIAAGKLHCLFGLGGVGKTLIATSLMAAVTTGGMWPDKSANGTVGSVAFLTAEDGIGDTILPRVQAAGGDPSRIWVLDNMFSVNGKGRFFNLSETDNVAYLERKLQKIPDLRILLINPITAFLGKADTHKLGDVRAALFPLSCLAERLGIAVIFIHHFNKMQGQSAMHRASGSTAFVDASRIAFMACDNPDAPNERHVLKVIKTNLGKKPPGIGYIIHSVPEFDTARIEWEDEPIEKSEAELLAPAGFSTPEQATSAELFLRDALGNGRRLARDVTEEAKSAGFTDKEIRTARERLHTIIKREGFGKDGYWIWMLPDDQQRLIDAIDAQSQAKASMGNNDRGDLFVDNERRALS